MTGTKHSSMWEAMSASKSTHRISSVMYCSCTFAISSCVGFLDWVTRIGRPTVHPQHEPTRVTYDNVESLAGRRRTDRDDGVSVRKQAERVCEAPSSVPLSAPRGHPRLTVEDSATVKQSYARSPSLSRLKDLGAQSRCARTKSEAESGLEALLQFVKCGAFGIRQLFVDLWDVPAVVSIGALAS